MRVALSQKHEMAYCRKIAREIITLRGDSINFEGSPALESVKRVAKAFLLISRGGGK